MVSIGADYRIIYRPCPNESACPVLNRVPDYLKGFIKGICDKGIRESPIISIRAIIRVEYLCEGCPAYH